MSENISENNTCETNLPEPEKLFGEPETSGSGKSEPGIQRRIQIPQYSLVERKYGGWIWVFVIVFLLFGLFKLSHIQLYRMQSDSMQSVLPKGSLVIVREVDPETIMIDDIITFVSAEGVLVTHQVVAIETDVDGHVAFRTQGTENDIIDRDVVTVGQLKGKMIKYISLGH